MSKNLFFYATGTDLSAIFEVAEHKRTLQFVRAGRFNEMTPEEFQAFRDLPNVGIANAGSSIACDSYLVSATGLKINARRLPSAPFFAFDQLVNAKTVLFTPGGKWKDKVFLRGAITTASKDEESLELMKLFRASFRKNCEIIKNNFVGREASCLWRQGTRLTFAEQSPPMYDLVA